LLKLIVEIVALSLIFWLEGVFPLFQERRQRLRHAFPNVTLGVVNGLMVALFFSSVMVQGMHWSRENSFGLLHRLSWSMGVEGVLAFALFDLWMYLWHMANHRIPLLWRFHRMHHSDMELDCTTALRFHSGEIILSYLSRLGIVSLLGMTYGQLLIYELCLQPVILFHHSNVALPEKWDRILRSLIVTPNMHRVHHSQEVFETNSNYSSVFSFWDRLAQTFRKRLDPKTLQYGLPYFQEAEWQTLRGLLKTPFVSVQRR
jgi:sterol desaturase/sphingolipid hydroxylase (fatty acid hydroxylase superfamily)